MTLAGILDTVLDRAIVPGYSRIGYQVRRTWWDDVADDALAGHTVAVTGANSGLGRATAAGVARLGATVLMLCRDAGRAGAARTEILVDVPDARLDVVVCDLADLGSVRAAAARIRDEHPALHGLVHNAGVLPPERTESVDGHELTVATHVLGPHLLTDLLRPVLAADGDARVVFVSSGGMYAQRLRIGDPEFLEGEFDGTIAYARTKRMQVVLSELWARRFAGIGDGRRVTVHSMHPGWADTPGVLDSLPRFAKLAGPILRTAEQGADTIVWLLASDEAGADTGRFWHDRRIRPTSYLPFTRTSAADADRLWDYCVVNTRA